MTRLYLIPLLLVALLLAACGGSNTSSSTSAPAAQPSAPSSNTTVASQVTAVAPNASTAAPPAATAAPNATAAPEAPNTTAAPPAATAASSGNPDAAIDVRLVTKDLRQPVFVTHAGDGSGRIFVVEKGGTISILRDGQRAAQPFLDVSSLITARGSEQGLLGLAFHPDYKTNGRFFIYYTAQNGDDTLARYQVSSNPDVADPASATVLFAVPDPAANHNGGMLAFGPDGYLYVGLGDGGSAGDPWGNGQNRNVLLGKMLRLSVDGDEPYSIPDDNPFASEAGARGEIWAYGLRNPWRFSFDRTTGDLFIGDVGQGQYEEIDLQPAGAKGGLNYGWNTREGMHCYQAQDCDSKDMVDPIHEYSHDVGCSVTGGYVYRGADFATLQGNYIFGDYCSGVIWSLHRTADGQWQQRELLQSGLSISSFGEDEAGELYLTDLSGALYQVIGA